MATRRGFGVAAAVAPEVIRTAAQTAESLGYDSFWVNDTPGADGLVALGHAALVTEKIKLGVGVIPLSRRSAASIVEQLQGMSEIEDQEGDVGDVVHATSDPERVRGIRLPLDRLLLGVGSGAGGRGSLERVRSGVATLTSGLDTAVFISALGPRMSRLAGKVADGVLFNWLSPEHARAAGDWVREGARSAGRETPVLASYVRVSLGPEGAERLRSEGERYLGIPAYASHFKRMGASPEDVSIMANSDDAIRRELERWDGVLDEVVVRSITPNDTMDETLALVRAGAPLG